MRTPTPNIASRCAGARLPSLVTLAAAVVAFALGTTRAEASSSQFPVPHSLATQSDSAAVVAVVEKFHAALAAGDSATALSLLANDVIILESGGVETRDEYRSHHLPGDIAFARAVPSTRAPLRATIKGDVAWVIGTSTTQGEYRGRQINSSGAELVVLSKSEGTWKIRAIHWSSRARR